MDSFTYRGHTYALDEPIKFGGMLIEPRAGQQLVYTFDTQGEPRRLTPARVGVLYALAYQAQERNYPKPENSGGDMLATFLMNLGPASDWDRVFKDEQVSRPPMHQANGLAGGGDDE
jgi:hypothetical protein